MDIVTLTKRIEKLEREKNLANQPTAEDRMKIIESVMFQQYLDPNSELYHEYNSYASSWQERMGEKAFNELLDTHKKAVEKYKKDEAEKKKVNERIRKQLEQLQRKTEKKIKPRNNKKEIQLLKKVIGGKERVTDSEG